MNFETPLPFAFGRRCHNLGMLKVESDLPILRVTLARPEVRNAFNSALIDQLTECFTQIPPDIRAVVLTGEGESFCAGGDLQWMREAANFTEEQNYQDARRLAELFQTMVNSPVPILARVNGATFGGGCGLVAACDVAIASPSALFAFSEVKLGLVPATISPFVVAKIGNGHARALFSTGEVFDAERALFIGLVHEVSAELDLSIDRKLKAILAAGPQAVAKSKWLAQQSPLALDDAARLLATVRSGDEAKEGIDAFLNKRKASYVVNR